MWTEVGPWRERHPCFHVAAVSSRIANWGHVEDDNWRGEVDRMRWDPKSPCAFALCGVNKTKR